MYAKQFSVVGRLQSKQFSRKHLQFSQRLVLLCPPGICTYRGTCDDDADARQRQAAKNISGLGRAGATGSGQCTCNVPRPKGGNLEMLNGYSQHPQKTGISRT